MSLLSPCRYRVNSIAKLRLRPGDLRSFIYAVPAINKRPWSYLNPWHLPYRSGVSQPPAMPAYVHTFVATMAFRMYNSPCVPMRLCALSTGQCSRSTRPPLISWSSTLRLHNPFGFGKSFSGREGEAVYVNTSCIAGGVQG